MLTLISLNISLKDPPCFKGLSLCPWTVFCLDSPPLFWSYHRAWMFTSGCCPAWIWSAFSYPVEFRKYVWRHSLSHRWWQVPLTQLKRSRNILFLGYWAAIYYFFLEKSCHFPIELCLIRPEQVIIHDLEWQRIIGSIRWPWKFPFLYVFHHPVSNPSWANCSATIFFTLLMTILTVLCGAIKYSFTSLSAECYF